MQQKFTLSHPPTLLWRRSRQSYIQKKIFGGEAAKNFFPIFGGFAAKNSASGLTLIFFTKLLITYLQNLHFLTTTFSNLTGELGNRGLGGENILTIFL